MDVGVSDVASLAKPKLVSQNSNGGLQMQALPVTRTQLRRTSSGNMRDLDT